MAFAVLSSPPCLADGVLEGRVVRVVDGDTIEVLAGETTTRVRLAGIDTPERGQPWASHSRRALSERVAGKSVRVIEVAVDRFGRTVGEVYADDRCVGCELVRDGHAWVYRRFSDDPVLLELEADARAAGRGLWSLPESQRTPPWEWRRQHPWRPDSAGKPRSESRAGFDCGTPRSCREMTSCDEARFYFDECGLDRLDGDADGVPCEKLCGGSRP